MNKNFIHSNILCSAFSHSTEGKIKLIFKITIKLNTFLNVFGGMAQEILNNRENNKDCVLCICCDSTLIYAIELESALLLSDFVELV